MTLNKQPIDKTFFDGLFFELVKLKPDLDAHLNVIAEKETALNRLRDEAESYKTTRKIKYNTLQKLIQQKENDLDLLRRTSKAATEQKQAAFKKEYDIFEAKVLAALINADNQEITDYVFSRFNEDFDIHPIEMERKIIEHQELLKDQQSKSTQHSKEKVPWVVMTPQSGKHRVIDVSGPTPTRRVIDCDVISVVTNIPITLEKFDRQEFVRDGSRASFGRNIS